LKKASFLLISLVVITMSALTISCQKKTPTPYMKKFSEDLSVAVARSNFKKLDNYFGTAEDFGKMISNAKTKTFQNKIRRSWIDGAARSFRITVKAAGKDAGKISRIKFVRLAYGAPEDPTVFGSPVKFGYVSCLPTRGYIVFKYWKVGEKIVLTYLKYQNDKPSRTGHKIFDIASDQDVELFDSNTSISYQ